MIFLALFYFIFIIQFNMQSDLKVTEKNNNSKSIHSCTMRFHRHRQNGMRTFTRKFDWQNIHLSPTVCTVAFLEFQYVIYHAAGITLQICLDAVQSLLTRLTVMLSRSVTHFWSLLHCKMCCFAIRTTDKTKVSFVCDKHNQWKSICFSFLNYPV